MFPSGGKGLGFVVVVFCVFPPKSKQISGERWETYYLWRSIRISVFKETPTLTSKVVWKAKVLPVAQKPCGNTRIMENSLPVLWFSGMHLGGTDLGSSPNSNIYFSTFEKFTWTFSTLKFLINKYINIWIVPLLHKIKNLMPGMY